MGAKEEAELLGRWFLVLSPKDQVFEDRFQQRYPPAPDNLLALK